MAWLMRGDDVLATAEVAATRNERRKGLMGRDCVDGAFVIERCRNVHTFGMKVPIDVAFCDRDGCVLRIITIAPKRISPFVARSAFIIEAGAGCCERWNLRAGDIVELTQ